MLYSQTSDQSLNQPLLPKQPSSVSLGWKLTLNVMQIMVNNILVLGAMAGVIYIGLYNPIGNKLKAVGLDVIEDHLSANHTNATTTAICAAFAKNDPSFPRDLCLEELPLAVNWLRLKIIPVIENIPLAALSSFIIGLSTAFFIFCVASSGLHSAVNTVTNLVKDKVLTLLSKPKASQDNPIALRDSSTTDTFGPDRIGLSGVNF